MLRLRSHRGTNVYDPVALGYADDGPYVLDTGHTNTGHEYGPHRIAGRDARVDRVPQDALTRDQLA